MSDDEEKNPLLLLSSATENDDRNVPKMWLYDMLPCIPTRYVLVMISFLGFANVYALRINLSIAIVAMVNSSATHNTRLQYNWTSQQEGWVLSSFFYGYVITQIPGGYLAGRFGGRYIFGIGILMTAVLTLLTPLAAQIHIGVLIALRVLEGFFEGVTFPAMHALLGKWSPNKERTIMATLAYSGPIVGNIISFPLSAVLCEYGFAGGWPSVFYVFGGVGMSWFVFWLYFGYSSPATHPRISKAERRYIESSIADSSSKVENNNGKTPWLSIMTSPAVWGIIIAFFCYNWGSYTLLTCIPSYFKDVLGLSLGNNLIQNGIFSAIPYAAFTLVALASGPVADILRRKYLSTVIVRKVFSTAGFFLSAAGLLSVGYLGSNKFISVLFLAISIGFGALSQAGFNINHIDIAPQYAGVLMGITNMAGAISGILGPLVAKTIAHKPPPGGQENVSVYQEEWREVFILSAELYIFGALVYLILGRGERQWWDGGERRKRHVQIEGNSSVVRNSYGSNNQRIT